eukprot:CAMPEP_0115470710 /NCGR_PEP_ID=MMETSP0271-20121206/52148_1 /TAXON_ID=71861 /ORGANISM="Scrippsiella trochoidea, Strain CCMP3099" /LENGTH=151 /DNA_ID=CAMNT_0002897873 /DNA_START=333 /DNA_END=788 /DNA_ORIENTATION=+
MHLPLAQGEACMLIRVAPLAQLAIQAPPPRRLELAWFPFRLHLPLAQGEASGGLGVPFKLHLPLAQGEACMLIRVALLAHLAIQATPPRHLELAWGALGPMLQSADAREPQPVRRRQDRPELAQPDDTLLGLRPCPHDATVRVCNVRIVYR